MVWRLTLDKLRLSPGGHSQRVYIALLRRLGYELERQTRHGARLSHPLLRKHPDLQIRRDRSWVLIPRGRRLRAWVAETVLASVEVLEKYRKELSTDA